MPRALLWGLAAAVVVLATVIAAPSFSTPPVLLPRDAGVDAAPSPPADAAPAKATPALAIDVPELRDEPEAGPPVEARPSGASMPKSVRVGVILVAFRGAEGASDHARPKDEARAAAERLSAQGRGDWKGAVAGGEPGSAEDLGRVPRGVLEPAVEGAVFSLPAGAVSEPIETPRGFWIVKRVE